MRILSLSGIIEDLKQVKDSNEGGRMAMTYFIASMVIESLSEALFNFFIGESASEATPPYQLMTLAAAIVGIFIVVLIVRSVLNNFLQSNGGGKEFIHRLIPLSFVIFNRIFIVMFPILIFVIKFVGDSKETDQYFSGLYIGLVLAALCMIIVGIVYFFRTMSQSFAAIAGPSPSEPI